MFLPPYARVETGRGRKTRMICPTTLPANERFRLRNTRLRGLARGGLPLDPCVFLPVAEEVRTHLRVTETHLPALRP